MFAVLTVERKKPENWWQAVRLRISRRAAVRCHTDVVRMAGFLEVHVTLPERAGARLEQRRLRQAFERMRAFGVHRAAAPEQTHELAKRMLVLPADSRQVLPACAERATMAALRAWGLSPDQVCVRLRARKVTRVVRNGALGLAPRVRYLHMALKSPAQALENHLYEEYGIATASELPTGVQTVDVMFDDEYETEAELTVHLAQGWFGNGKERYPLTLSAPQTVLGKLPEGASANDFVAVLFLCGGLPAAEIEVQTGMQRDESERS